MIFQFKKSVKAVKFIVLLLLNTGLVLAQFGENDPSFNPTDIGFGFGDAANNTIYATAMQTDGKIIIGGNFTSYDGTTRNRIARLNADGTLDDTFDPGTGANGTIFAVKIQSNGKIIIGGDFTSYNGITRNRIARLNADGTIDNTFSPETGANGLIYTIAIQADGKILIGGFFDKYNETSRIHIARINADGTLDASFSTGTGANFEVLTINIQTDGKIIIGGNFTSFNGTSANYIARLNSNGTIDATFNTGTGTNGTVSTAIIQSDGKIIIGGNFTSYNGIQRNYLARINSNGILDASFDPGAGANNSVMTLAMQTDGKFIIGGDFTSYRGTQRNYIARITSDGSLDTSFNSETGANNSVLTTIIQTNGKIIAGGSFTSYRLRTRNRIVCLNTDGSVEETFNPGTGTNGPVTSSALQADGKIVIGGNFTAYNGKQRNYIARLTADGALDEIFNPGMGPNNAVTTIAIQPDGKIVIGGYFTFYNETPRNYLARIDSNGSLDAAFNQGTGVNGAVNTIAIQPDGKVLIGGHFTSYNGTSRNYIARLKADGSIDETFNSGTGADFVISKIATQSDGKILIAGQFSSYNGTQREGIARLNADGSLDETFNPGIGANGTVSTISIQADGKIIIGGSFTSYNGFARNRIARLNPDGSLDHTFNPGLGADGSIYVSTIKTGGKIFIGGAFHSYNGTQRNYFACLNPDGSLNPAFNSEIGADRYVYTAAIQADEKIVIGGAFTSYNGTGRNRIARLLNCPSPNTGTHTVTACDKYTWIDGNTYTESNNTATYFLTNAAGCDSLVTLNLTINHSSTGTDVVTACDSYTWIDGNTYSSSNNSAKYVLTNAAGCDSVVTLNLTIKHSSAGTDMVTACNSYTWIDGITYTTPAYATYTITNAAGCDSVVTLFLTIKRVSDITTTTEGGTITANNPNANYRWLDCNNLFAEIPDQTDQSYTPAKSGSYAVELTENGCVDTSECVYIETVEIIENSLNKKITVYPNPTRGKITIIADSKLNNALVTVRNIKGQQISNQRIHSSDRIELNLNVSTGVYFIEILDRGKKATIKVMKE